MTLEWWKAITLICIEITKRLLSKNGKRCLFLWAFLAPYDSNKDRQNTVGNGSMFNIQLMLKCLLFYDHVLLYTISPKTKHRTHWFLSTVETFHIDFGPNNNNNNCSRSQLCLENFRSWHLVSRVVHCFQFRQILKSQVSMFCVFSNLYLCT